MKQKQRKQFSACSESPTPMFTGSRKHLHAKFKMLKLRLVQYSRKRPNRFKMKKIYISIITLCLFCFHLTAQDFDTQLEKLAEGLTKKINISGKTKIAVWGFFTENGERTSLGNYLTEDFSVYVTNFGDQLEVIDRNHLDVILKEHQLNAEGYIDQATAKQLGKIIAVDVIITGTYTVLNSVIKVRAKALDTETARQFAANMGNLPLNENISSYLGISLNGGNTTNRGFNTSLNSNETINSPDTVDEACRKNLTGDFCFSNALNEKVIIKINHFRYADIKKNNTNTKVIILDAKETKCVYGLFNRPIWYFVAKWSDFVNEEKFRGIQSNISHYPYAKFLKDKGELKVETCKSKTYTIK